jgi:TolB-like protein/DNA-binding winged helix-turn-helix (wHTH) protein
VRVYSSHPVVNPSHSRVYRFGPFEFEPQFGDLRKQGIRIRLEGQPVAILLMLLDHAGELVTREELQKKLWPADTFVDFEQSLNAAVKRLRAALNDSADAPRYVETLARRGYRFIAPLDAVPSTQLLVSPEPPVPTSASVSKSRSTRRLWLILSAIAPVLVLAGFFGRSFFFWHPQPLPRKAMLVVLPFLNLSGDPQQDYFADGMTEEMVAQLGSLDPQHLGVIARTSSMQYKGAHKNVAQIARELGVNYVLEGSVRRSSDRIRVTAQLIQASDQTHLWAKDYDRQVSDVLKLQSDAARAIAAKIQLTLSQPVQARLSAASSVNSEAHEAYLLGLQAWNLRTQEGTDRSIAEFKRAIAIDPNYALAYSGLARAYSLVPVLGVEKPLDAMPLGRQAALRALQLDDSLAEAHTTLAFVEAHFDFDWPAAKREYLRALQLNPNDANAHFFYSNSFLSPFGHHDEAVAEMREAMRLDPLSIPIQSFFGRTLLWARRYNEALAQFQKAQQMAPDFAGDHERLSHLYTYLGNFDAAIQEESKARLLSGEDPRYIVKVEDALRQSLAAHGPRGYWEKLLEFSRSDPNPPEAYVGSYGRAIIYARLDKNNRALESLQKAYEERQIFMTEIGVEPAFDPLRSDPRFKSLLRRVGLAP